MFKPMLAPGEDPMSFPDYFKNLRYPLLCSPKYDGIRCIIKNTRAMSRTFKIIPSYQVQDEFNKLENFDGELIEGNPTDFDVYNRTQSHVMSEYKPGDISYFVFDYTDQKYLDKPFYQRLEYLEKHCKVWAQDNIKFIKHTHVENYEELLEYEKECLSKGFEGIMMRDPVGYYKCGRGTFREGLIYKLKRFKDSEGIILDISPMLQNNNKLEVDALGYAKRSSSKENLSETDLAGSFLVLFNGLEIDVAPGSFNHEQRYEMLQNKNEYIGKHLKFRYFTHGIKDKPRFPRALGIRSLMDV